MPKQERHRELRRRRARGKKIRLLKQRIGQSQDARIRKKLTDKLRKLMPFEALPEK
jgi:hypothetical protein